MVDFVKKKFQEITKNEFVKHVLTLISGTSIAQFIPILISPILTRIYTPEDFSVLGIYVSIAIILSEMITGKYELALMKAEEEEKASLVSLTLIFIGCATILFSILFFLFFDIFSFFKISGDAYWKYILLIIIAFLGITKLFSYLHIRAKNYKIVAYSKVSKSIVLACLQISFFSLKYIGLIIGFAVSSIVESIILIKKNRIYIKSVEVKEIKKTARKFAKFPLFEVPSSLFNIGTIQAPIILIPTYFGAFYGGFYFQAYKILTMPISLVGGAIGQVFFEQGSLLRDNSLKFSELVFKTHKNLFLISFIPLSIILFFGDDIFAFVFGNQWRISGSYAMIMIPWIFFNFLVSPISSVLIIKEKQHIGFVFITIMSFLRLIGLLLGIFYFKDIYSTIALFSYISAICYFGYASFIVYRFLDFGVLKYWFFIIKIGGSLCLLLFIIKYFLNHIIN